VHARETDPVVAVTTYPATYCPDCGSELDTRHVQGRDRQYCERCERVVWRNPVPCAGVAVVDPDRGVLLTLRDVDPGRGHWAVPGGHMEIDESPRVAAARELAEETGVTVDPDALVINDTFDAGHPDGKRVVSIGYATHVDDTTGTPTVGPEVQAVEWFTPSEFDAFDGAFYDDHDRRFERAWTRLGSD
jgi:8-oxo-dGTP diphosphatase